MKNRFKNLTTADLVEVGIYENIDFDKLMNDLQAGRVTTKELLTGKLDKSNIYMKDYFLKEKLTELVAIAENPKPAADEIITDYFRKDFNNLSVIGYRYGKRQPESIEKKLQGWQFEGFITFGQLQSFTDSFTEFKQEFNKYDTATNYFLDLNIIGGIVENHCLISYENMQDWSDQENVNFEPWGFDDKGRITCFSDMLLKAFAQLEAEATKIKMKGKPETLAEARTLKQAAKGKMYLNLMFNGMLDLSLLGGPKK